MVSVSEKYLSSLINDRLSMTKLEKFATSHGIQIIFVK